MWTASEPSTGSRGCQRGSSTSTWSRHKRQIKVSDETGIWISNAGALKLKTALGEYHEIKDCLEPMCDGKDELGHIKICPYYTTKWKDEYEMDSKMLAIYLVGVDKERRRKWKGECLF